MMKHPFTGLALFLLSLPLVAGTGYFYQQNRTLEHQVRQLQEKKEKIENSNRSNRLSEDEKKKLDRRIKQAQQELLRLKSEAETFETDVEKKMNVDADGNSQVSRKEQVQKLKNEMKQLAVNEIQTRRDQRREERQSNRTNRWVNWLSSRMENWDEKQKKAESEFGENVLKGMDLDKDQKEVAKQVFNNYLNRVKEVFANTLERMKQEDLSPRTAFTDGWSKIQKERIDQQQKLNDADFSDEQSQTFWDRSRRVMRRMIF